MKNYLNSTNSKFKTRHSDESQNPSQSKSEVQNSTPKQNAAQKLPLLPRIEIKRKAEQQRGQGGFHHQTQAKASSKAEISFISKKLQRILQNISSSLFSYSLASTQPSKHK